MYPLCPAPGCGLDTPEGGGGGAGTGTGIGTGTGTATGTFMDQFAEIVKANQTARTQMDQLRDPTDKEIMAMLVKTGYLIPLPDVKLCTAPRPLPQDQLILCRKVTDGLNRGSGAERGHVYAALEHQESDGITVQTFGSGGAWKHGQGRVAEAMAEDAQPPLVDVGAGSTSSAAYGGGGNSLLASRASGHRRYTPNAATWRGRERPPPPSSPPESFADALKGVRLAVEEGKRTSSSTGYTGRSPKDFTSAEADHLRFRRTSTSTSAERAKASFDAFAKLSVSPAASIPKLVMPLKVMTICPLPWFPLTGVGISKQADKGCMIPQLLVPIMLPYPGAVAKVGTFSVSLMIVIRVMRACGDESMHPPLCNIPHFSVQC